MSCTDLFYRAIYCVLFDSIQESVFSLISLNIQKLKKKNSGIFISFTPVEIHCYGTNAFWRNHVALSFGVPRVSSVGLSISGIRLLVGYFNHLNSFSWKCLWCLVGAMPEKGLDLIFLTGVGCRSATEPSVHLPGCVIISSITARVER